MAREIADVIGNGTMIPAGGGEPINADAVIAERGWQALYKSESGLSPPAPVTD